MDRARALGRPDAQPSGMPERLARALMKASAGVVLRAPKKTEQLEIVEKP